MPARRSAALPQVAAALQQLHAIGIVHMDVKPENSYRAFDGRRVAVLCFMTRRLCADPHPPPLPRFPSPDSIKLGDLGGCGMPNMPPVSGKYGDCRYLAHEGVTGLQGRTCSQGMTIDDLTKLDVFALGMSV